MNEQAARDAFETALATHEPAFGTFFLAKYLGFEIAYEDDACVVAYEVREDMFNPQGSMHGGLMGVGMDVSMGHLIHHLTGKPGITLDMRIQYMRPAHAGPRALHRPLPQARPLDLGDGIAHDRRCGQASRHGDGDLADAEDRRRGLSPGGPRVVSRSAPAAP